MVVFLNLTIEKDKVGKELRKFRYISLVSLVFCLKDHSLIWYKSKVLNVLLRKKTFLSCLEDVNKNSCFYLRITIEQDRLR